VTASAPAIEVVRGRLDDERAGRLLDFWVREGAMTEDEGRARLPQVICLALDASGAIAGSSSAYVGPVPTLGDRPFWIYRSYVRDDAADAWAMLVQHSFHALEAEAAPGGPLGLCMLVGDRALLARYPEAIWLWPRALYAGYTAEGRQVRIRWFETAMVRPAVMELRTALEPGYRVEVYADQTDVDDDAIVGLWTREGILAPDEARRRVGEVLLVATHEGEPVGVVTTFLGHNPQLGLDLWYYRTFVAAEHRRSRVAWALMLVARDHLQQRYVSGADTRAAGIGFNVENEAIRRRANDAGWDRPLDFTMVGENERGEHVRVHYFPGAPAPPPP
jgi:hypothetical protein